MINNQLIRCSLNKFIEKNNLSMENVIYIKYFPLISKPEENLNKENPDWVSSISSTQLYFCSGCYDNKLRLYDDNMNVILELLDHSLPIKSTDIYNDNEKIYLFSGSQDQSINIYQYNISNKSIKKDKCNGHNSSVEALSYRNNRLVSGGFNGSICIWGINDDDNNERNIKKQKTSKDNKDTLNEIIVLLYFI